MNVILYLFIFCNYSVIFLWKSPLPRSHRATTHTHTRRGSRKKIEGGFICRPPTVKLAQYNKDCMTFLGKLLELF